MSLCGTDMEWLHLIAANIRSTLKYIGIGVFTKRTLLNPGHGLLDEASRG